MTSWLELAGRHAVVAGAGGIGSCIARALADAGADVVVLDRDEARLAQIARPAPTGPGSTAAPMTSSGPTACGATSIGPTPSGPTPSGPTPSGTTSGGAISGVAADLTSADACRAALAAATDRLGGLDVFVHAVGINDRRPVLDMPDEVWDRLIALNLSSAFWLGRAAGAVTVASGYGRIVYLSSVSGLLAHRDHAPYAATKGGLNQLVRVMAREWAASGVTVNAVAPGYVETELTRAHLAKPGVRESLEALVPTGRLGTPEELTGPVLFLASDRASFVTGQVLYVDGGRTLV